MKLDVLAYPKVFQIIKKYLEVHPETESLEAIRELSILTYCHIIIVAYYVQQIRGDTPELEQYIKDLITFYKPDEIVGVEELKKGSLC